MKQTIAIAICIYFNAFDPSIQNTVDLNTYLHTYVHNVIIPGRAPIIYEMAIVTVNSLHCGVTYNITAQGMYNNRTLVGPGSSYGAITTGVCPLTTSKDTYVRMHIYICTCIRIYSCA